MTACMWCDIGQHPFPMGQPGSTQIGITEQVGNQWGGQQPHKVMQDVCAACAKDVGIRAGALVREQTPEQQDAEAARLRDMQGGLITRALEAAKPKRRVRVAEPYED